MTRLLHLTPPNAFRRTGYGSDNGVFYLLQDHLKSSSAVINQNGTLNSQNYYFPYGGNRGSTFSTLTTKRFTGQYHEAALPGDEGLSYYGARWYDAQLGRFVSADTLVPNPANPQAFNRYSYVFNNPLNYIDPTGHLPISDTRFLYDDGGSITNGGGSSRPFVQYLASYQGLFGTTRQTYRFYTGSTWNRNNIATGMRLLWDASLFSAPSRDLDYAYGAWQAWGQQNVQRLPEPLRTVAGVVNDPFVQEVLLATISVPGGTVDRASSRALGQGLIGFRSFTKSNFRENLSRLTGVRPDRTMEAHHVLPVKLEKDFARVGINIHDPRYGSWVDAAKHRQWSNAYNQRWDDFFTRNRHPSLQQIEGLAVQLSEEYGFNVYFRR